MYDVLVVGAGLSGLQAAVTAHKAGDTVLVLEARDRVGGKTWSVPLASGRGSVEFGAAWINDTNQRRMWSYVQQFGLEMVQQRAEGNCIMLEQKGKKHTFPFGKSPNVSFTVRGCGRILMSEVLCRRGCRSGAHPRSDPCRVLADYISGGRG